MNGSNGQPDGFQTTQWSLVLSAGEQVGEFENQSLQELCKRYWRPLYLFARRNGQSSERAEDLVQAFFLHLLEKKTLSVADRQRGRFRTFLLAAMTNFLRNQHAKQNAIKRGGSTRLLSLDIRDAEGDLINQATDPCTAEEEFDRQWAITVLNDVLASMKSAYQARGQAELFDTLAPFLGLEGAKDSYAHKAQDLQMTPNAVKVAVHRLRREYRRQLEAVVAATVQCKSEIRDELQILLNALNPRQNSA